LDPRLRCQRNFFLKYILFTDVCSRRPIILLQDEVPEEHRERKFKLLKNKQKIKYISLYLPDEHHNSTIPVQIVMVYMATE